LAASTAVPDLEAEESGSGIVGDNDDEHGFQDDDEDLLYRVPVFDPMLAEFYNPVADEGEQKPLAEFYNPVADDGEQKPACLMPPLVETSLEFAYGGSAEADGLSAGFDVPDMELASFAADMESLLMGVNDGFDDLGFLDEEKPQVNADADLVAMAAPALEREDKKRKRPEMILKLNYEGVIASWVRDGGSPWFHGERPHLDPYELWSDFPVSTTRFKHEIYIFLTFPCTVL
jgi:hypothetical protein